MKLTPYLKPVNPNPMKTIRSIIVDDDAFMRDLLRDKIRSYVPNIEVVAMAKSGSEGIEAIHKYQPDLVFLDVEIGDMTGFELLEQISSIDFQVIFVTSYDHYAIKAIRFNALDYLVKPIDIGDLKQAIKRYEQNFNITKPKQLIENALVNFKIAEPGEQTLLLNLQEGEMKILINNIIYLEGERNYTTIHTAQKKKIITSKTLGLYEEMLDENLFFRIHKTYIVNKNHILFYNNGSVLSMTDQIKLDISRRKVKEFSAWMALVS